MRDTGHILPREEVGRLAALYRAREGGGLELIEAPASSAHVLPPGFAYEPGTAWLPGGGMMVSTVADYARLVHVLLNGGMVGGTRLLSPQTVALMVANHLPAGLPPIDPRDPGLGHGLGVRVWVDASGAEETGPMGAFTGDGGHGTFFWGDPAEGLVGLLMLQLNPIPYPIHRAFRVLVYQALAGP
jgi:CubicO group peptidase (beta-lactamase class C family)